MTDIFILEGIMFSKDKLDIENSEELIPVTVDYISYEKVNNRKRLYIDPKKKIIAGEVHDEDNGPQQFEVLNEEIKDNCLNYLAKLDRFTKK